MVCGVVWGSFSGHDSHYGLDGIHKSFVTQTEEEKAVPHTNTT